MDFKNAKELLDFCQKLNCPISDIMKQRECTLAETSLEDIYAKMDHALSIMRESASSPIQEPKKSIGGLIGGEARLADLHRARGAAICGSVLSRAITYSMAVLETNTSICLLYTSPLHTSVVHCIDSPVLSRKKEEAQADLRIQVLYLLQHLRPCIHHDRLPGGYGPGCLTVCHCPVPGIDISPAGQITEIPQHLRCLFFGPAGLSVP